MQGNKICVTEKGLDYLNDGHAEYQNKPISKATRSNASSLPSISATDRRCESLMQKSCQNKKLSQLSLTLQKMQKIGLKKLTIQKEDQKLEEILKNQAKAYPQKYLTALIPIIVRKTRDVNRTGNISSRYNRSVAYTERLLQNHRQHQGYGVKNHIRDGKEGGEE